MATSRLLPGKHWDKQPQGLRPSAYHKAPRLHTWALNQTNAKENDGVQKDG